MESFKFLYFEACESFNIPRCGKLLTSIEDAGSSTTLNLSGAQFSDSTCKVLGQALAKDVHIKELDCTNCRFSDEGLKSILLGIEKNKFLSTLHLKGNNIRSLGTEALGKLVRHNNHLQNLNLEWNGLGIFPEKFVLFCEGLCSNNSLKILDLRNNQLSHICAQSLSNVILRNLSLQKLDIRWNNIGLTGGRVILKSLSGNKSILSLEADGNDIPMDILEAIKIATSASSQRFIANNEQIAKSKYMTSRLQALEEEKHTQVKCLMEQLDKMDGDALKNERWNTKKLSEAEAALIEKDKNCEYLTIKIREIESELWTLSLEKNQLALSLNAMETRNKELKDEHQLVLDKETKKKEETESGLLKQIGSLKEENIFFKQQIQDMKIKLTHAEDKNLELKQNIIKLEKSSEQVQTLLKDQLSTLNKKHTEDLEEKELLHEREFSRLKEEFSQEKKSFKNKQSILESKNNDLEQKLEEKNAQLFSERSQSEEKLLQLENKLKSDHKKVRKKLEERIEMLEDANKEQYDHLQKDLELMYQLKTDVTALDLNLAEQDHEIDQLQKLLREKDAEMKACEAKVRLEVKEQLRELQDSKETIQKYIHEHSLLQKAIKEMEIKHKEELEIKTNINLDLKSEIQLLQEKITEMTEDEKNRLQKLQRAIEVYLKPGVQKNEGVSQLGDISMVNNIEE